VFVNNAAVILSIRCEWSMITKFILPHGGAAQSFHWIIEKFAEFCVGLGDLASQANPTKLAAGRSNNAIP
jgi:hypothetical protein